MIREVALITVSAVLFVQMGLSDTIQDVIHFRSRIASCPKCVSFWSVLAYCILTERGVIVSVASSFICAYVALWIALAYDALALIYNTVYESITETKDTASDAGPGPASPDATTASDEVPQM